MKEKNYEEAIKWYTKSIELDDGKFVYYSNRALAYFNLEQFEEAARDAKLAIQAAAKNQEFHKKSYYRYVKAMVRIGDEKVDGK